VEALRPGVETGRLGLVDQRQGRRHAVGRKVFLVEVDPDVRDQRLPLRLHQHLRVVEGRVEA